MPRHRALVPATELVELRSRLSLTQQQLADRLGVSRRTIIRGEQRGIDRGAVGKAFARLKAEGDSLPAGKVSRPKVSRQPPRKRLRRSSERLQAWREKGGDG